MDIKPEDWLRKEVDKFHQTKSDSLSIPKRSDGKEYRLEDLRDDQREIAITILGKVKDWMEREYKKPNFKPLRMIVRGAGGSGKSVLLNTVVSYLH